ncbi:MAG: bifunctional hydroxymethylpyrimidine kinase/phosphomethylpyrimidine kinase [Nocardioidaceae bacterium]
MTPPVALAVAGTDSGGAAGLAADLTTFAALGVHGAMAVTAVTAQDTTGVHGVVPIDAEQVRAQVRAVREDLPVAAAKTGMLGSAATVTAMAEALRGTALVVDPVLVATSGAVLGDDDVVAAYLADLLPVATVVTPNRHEAARLLGLDSIAGSEVDAARALHDLGLAVVLTGGGTEDADCVDVLVDGGGTHLLRHPAVPTENDHGTGCTFSAALAALLARGLPLAAAARGAQGFVARALHTSKDWRLGRGRGPVAHTHHTKES